MNGMHNLIVADFFNLLFCFGFFCNTGLLMRRMEFHVIWGEIQFCVIGVYIGACFIAVSVSYHELSHKCLRYFSFPNEID